MMALSLNIIQSAWDPASRAAGDIKNLTWFLIVVCTLVFITVMGLMLQSIWKKKSPTGVSPGNKFVLWSGLIFPSLILIIILIYSLQSTMEVRTIISENRPLLIRVIGHQWWWEVHYPEQGIITANEIHVPTGREVIFELTSQDVIHSFWVPNVHGKLDMLPDHITKLNVMVDRPGIYRGQCAEFCGTQHALMALSFVVLKEDEFEQWSRSLQSRPALPEPSTSRGKEVFFEQSCHTCHAVKGTDAVGRTGPDLTYLSRRLTLGAGTVKNTPENLRHWVQHSRKIKPGNRMPNYEIPEDDLKALLQYLSELR